MTDPIRDAAIEAAARELFADNERERAEAWGDNNARPWIALKDEAHRQFYRDTAAPLVDAVLAVVGPAYRAEALRDAGDDLEPLVDGQHPDALNPDQWLRDRADAEEQR